jgi:hypothetical protein
MWLFMQDLQQEGDAAHADPLHGRETVEMTHIVERKFSHNRSRFPPCLSHWKTMAFGFAGG